MRVSTLDRISVLYEEKSLIYKTYRDLDSIYVKNRLHQIEYALSNLWVIRRREIAGPPTILRKKRHKYLEMY